MSLGGGDMAKRKKAPGHIWPTDVLDDGFTTVPHDLPGALAGSGLTASAVLIIIHGLLRRAYRGPTVFPSLEDIAIEAGLWSRR